jgi:Zn-dependent protease with chaperone function
VSALAAPEPDRARRRRRERIALALALAAGALAWAWAADALWHSSVPAGLSLPSVEARRFFSTAFLRRSASFERFLAVDALLARVVLVAVLAVYAVRGRALMRESAAGRIGTGMLLGMLGFAIVWLAELPFGLAAVAWERSHDVSREGYVTWAVRSFVALGYTFLFVSLALALAMGVARWLASSWWLVTAPLFVGLALLATFLSVYLVPATHPLRDPVLLADARALERREGVSPTKVLVQEVRRETTAPNAESVGFGPTRAVVLWDTLLDGRFDRAQVRSVIAHELGHLAHHHQLKRIGWLALFLIPASALVALLTRRRGGMARPESVPLALLVVVVLQLLTLPAQNLISRHEEAEADWSSLAATHQPAVARALFVKLAQMSLASPDPPVWSYVLYADHPTIVQRIAMTEAWRPGG